MKKYCVKCGHEFVATGREVICPACKENAKEEAKKAAVLKAKAKSWTGESVPVRISGRASTVIRRYGTANGMSFAQALDELLKSTNFFKSVGQAWEEVTPYKSHRRDKTAEDKPAKAPSAPSNKPVVQAAKVTSKTTVKKATSKAASKAVKAQKGEKKE